MKETQHNLISTCPRQKGTILSRLLCGAMLLIAANGIGCQTMAERWHDYTQGEPVADGKYENRWGDFVDDFQNKVSPVQKRTEY